MTNEEFKKTMIAINEFENIAIELTRIINNIPMNHEAREILIKERDLSLKQIEELKRK